MLIVEEKVYVESLVVEEEEEEKLCKVSCCCCSKFKVVKVKLDDVVVIKEVEGGVEI